ncbi:MAG: DUF3570 domain-containing protein, partial [Undibacterium sp.]|nr:DUF3570 domain-containing protein [Undibacterium sp.]
PRERNSQSLSARWNHHVTALDGTTRLSYRYFSDSWGIQAHTLNIEYVQSLPNAWSLTPLVRLYSQSAAHFYVDAGPSDFPFPPNPPEGALHFSEDQRLSAFGARTYGFKLSKRIDADWSVDLKFEQYTQRSRWRWFGSGSPGLLAFYARSIQLGVSRQF